MYVGIAEVILEIISIIMTIGIIVTYGLGAYWNIRYLAGNGKPYICKLKAFTAFVSLGFVIVYFVLLLNILFFRQIETSLFGLAFIRPLIVMMGCSVAANARTRYLYQKMRGE